MAPHAPRRWDGVQRATPLFALKADLMALLDELGAPVARCRSCRARTQPWWHPGRSARLQLGPKAVIAEFGELHPRVLKALDAEAPLYAFELDAGRDPRAQEEGRQDQAGARAFRR